MNRKTLSVVQAAAAVVPLATRKMPKKQRLLIWVLTTALVAWATKMAHGAAEE